MNKLLWILQYFLGIYWVALGILHFVVPPGLPGPFAWMYELDPTLHAISGTHSKYSVDWAILLLYSCVPLPLAAVGLSLVMVGAMVARAALQPPDPWTFACFSCCLWHGVEVFVTADLGAKSSGDRQLG